MENNYGQRLIELSYDVEKIKDELVYLKEWRKEALNKASLLILSILMVLGCILIDKLFKLIGEDFGDVLETIANAGAAMSLFFALRSRNLGALINRMIEKDLEKDL